jgi:hypothetical protein
LQITDELRAGADLFKAELFDLWRLDFLGGLLVAFLVSRFISIRLFNVLTT